MSSGVNVLPGAKTSDTGLEKNVYSLKVTISMNTCETRQGRTRRRRILEGHNLVEDSARKTGMEITR